MRNNKNASEANLDDEVDLDDVRIRKGEEDGAHTLTFIGSEATLEWILRMELRAWRSTQAALTTGKRERLNKTRH